jgi:hypothetical protein
MVYPIIKLGAGPFFQLLNVVVKNSPHEHGSPCSLSSTISFGFSFFPCLSTEHTLILGLAASREIVPCMHNWMETKNNEIVIRVPRATNFENQKLREPRLGGKIHR